MKIKNMNVNEALIWFGIGFEFGLVWFGLIWFDLVWFGLGLSLRLCRWEVGSH